MFPSMIYVPLDDMFPSMLDLPLRSSRQPMDI